MIFRVNAEHIKDFVRNLKIRPDIVELDYVQNWILFGLSKTELCEILAFKGGTCLKKVYFKNYRFSKDLDFTIIQENFSMSALESLIEEAIKIANEESGIKFWFREIREGKSSIFCEVKWRSILHGKDRKLEFNITKFRYEFITDNYPKKSIIHEPYNSIEKDYQAEVTCYTLEEILAEKIRTLFERRPEGAWPRDLYDVWMLIRDAKVENLEPILEKKLKKRRIKIDITKLLKRKEILQKSWQSSLEHLIPTELPEFSRVFSDVISYLCSKVKVR